MTTQSIDVTRIDVGTRIRNVRPERAAAMAESIAEHGLLQPIKVIQTADGFRLVFGETRLVAIRDILRLPEIEAIVVAEAAFGGEARRQIEGIVENFVQFPMTVLEQAVALADWKDLYEAQNQTAGRGGKRPKKVEADQTDNLSVCFSTAAAEVLGCSDRHIRRAIVIARGIAEPVRQRIASHPIADHQGELTALAAQPEGRQAAIVGLILAEPAQTETVAGAIALIDRVPVPVQLQLFERVSERFARLPQREQHAFFAIHEAAYDLWKAGRTGSAKAA